MDRDIGSQRKKIPVTVENLEKGLDTLAWYVDQAAPKIGMKMLPLYRRLEDEIVKLNEAEGTLDRAKARLANARACGAYR